MSVLTASLLERLDWLEHGFGTRHANLDQATMASLKQIHSNISLAAHGPGCAGEGDALLTSEPGVAVSVRTADCFPILLADPNTRAVAAVHAGWRGTAAGVVRASLTRMRSEFGTDPRNVFAAIGPGIGACCYEVGIEVARQFGMPEAGNLDLAAENRRQLIAAGLKPDSIEVVGDCTFCTPARFFSWRRDQDRAGRMISFIRVTA
ncbi:MAG: peptidoglycan editing factor PgeF [Acidobacteriia bacterium]|nr:peptidoglycan editing factor PgeF [Terriglobia bacterium]